jgi:hypothetical protein
MLCEAQAYSAITNAAGRGACRRLMPQAASNKTVDGKARIRADRSALVLFSRLPTGDLLYCMYIKDARQLERSFLRRSPYDLWSSV